MAADPHPIEIESYRHIDERIDLSQLGDESAAVIRRVIHASADLDYATSMVLDEQAVRAGVSALASGEPVITDVEMVRQGINVVEALCYLSQVCTDDAPTRTAAGMSLAALRHPRGAVFVVGCAPTALFEIVRLIGERKLLPALVVGMPVGFVGAADAKEALRATGIPNISNVGEKGGSAVAAAVVNALVGLAQQEASKERAT